MPAADSSGVGVTSPCIEVPSCAPVAYTLWLDPAMRAVETIQAPLTGYPADEVIAYPVSMRVNNAAYDSPECIAPLS